MRHALRLRLGLGALLIVVTVGAYWPTFSAGFLIDDAYWLWDNPHIEDVWGPLKYFTGRDLFDYYPVTSLSFWVQYRMFGEDATGYHIVSLVEHILACLLLWRVLTRLGLRESAAWAAALLVAVHPVCVQSVGWISEQKNTLSQVFFAAAVLVWLRFDERRKGADYALALLLYGVGLLCKVSGVTLSLVLPLLVWYRHGRLRRHDWIAAAPFVMLAMLAAMVAIIFQSQNVIGDEVVRPEGLLSRVAAAGWALWFYVGKALWPHPLLIGYPRWDVPLDVWWVYLPGAVWVVMLVAARKHRGLFLAIAGFTLLLAPVLGLVSMFYHRFSLVADHWQYVALPVTAALVAAWVDRITRHAALVGVVSAVALGVLTFHRMETFGDARLLWEHELKHHDASWWAHASLGHLLIDQKQPQTALPHLARAAQLNPQLGEVRREYGRALWDFAGQARWGEAIAELRRAVELNDRDALAQFLLARSLSVAGRIAEALPHYERSLQVNPDDPEVRANYGAALMAEGRLDEAIAQLRRSVEDDPSQSLAYLNLGLALLQKDQVQRGVEYLRRAHELAIRQGRRSVAQRAEQVFRQVQERQR